MSTIKIIDVNVSGLNPNNKYRFKFTNNGGNWPVKVTPLSGIFYPNKVKTYVYFCSTTGECPPSDANVFFNTPQTNITHPGLSVGPKSLYSVLGLSITEYDNVNDIIYTHPCIVECDECAPQLTIKTNSVSLNRTTGGSAKIISEVSGLIPNQTYTYVFNGAGGNWPVKIIPRSGTINSSDQNIKIDSLLSLCSSSGSCSENTDNVINYNNTESNVDREDLYSAINLTIQPANTTLQSSSSSSFSVTCDDCLPKVRATLPDTKTINGLSSEAYSNFDAKLENLIIGQEYSYDFSSSEANWPVLIQPKSGTLTAYDSTVTLPIRLTFCPSVELCENNTEEVLEYVLNSPSEISFGLLDKRARVKLNVVQNSNENSISSNELTVFCQNCNSTPRISIPNSIDLASGNDSEIFNATISNLIPYSHYRYIFQSTDSNWPVTISPMSGTIISTTSTSTISAKLSFCRSTGICPSSDPNVLDYTINAACATKAGNISRNLKLKLIVDPVNYDAESAHSNEMFAYCDNCIPTLETSLPKNLTLNSNSSHVDIVANATNLIPGSKYSYEFKGFDSNWPSILYPMSGTITATSPNQTITSKLTFCPSTGACPNGMINVVPYSLGSTYLMNLGVVDKNVKLRLELKDANCNDNISNSNDCIISCEDCLPKIKAILPSTLALDSTKDFKNFDVTFHNLIAGQEYSYNFSSSEANWPTTISPISGTIIPVASTLTMSAKLSFCRSTGICPSSDPDVLDYSLDAACVTKAGNISKNLKLKLILDPLNYDAETVHSNEMFAYCDNCVPTLEASLPKNIILTANNSSVNVIASGLNLIPGSKYSYEFKGFDSNWPSILYPMSGTIIATTDSQAITSKLTFCPSTGSCPNGMTDVIPYSLGSTYLMNLGIVDKNVKLRLELKDANCNDSIANSNDCLISCDDCLPKTQAVLPTGINLTSGNFSKNFDTTLSNLIVGQEYSYQFNSINANWPVLIQPRSGTILATETVATIPTVLTFCPSTGLCPNGNANILPYTVNNSSDVTFGLSEKAATIKLTLNQSFNDKIIYSNESKISCNDCVARLKANIPDFMELTQIDNENTFTAIINNLIPHSEYEYSFESIEANWPVVISPLSGTLIPTATSGLIPVKLSFCVSTGICPSSNPDILDYVIDPACITKIGYVDRSAKFRLMVDPINYDAETIYSNQMTASCKTCLKILDASIPKSITLTSGTLNSVSITGNITNLVPGSYYDYEFKPEVSNWPSILHPMSGVIKADSRNMDIVTKLTFCPSTGAFPNGTPNVIPYVLDPLCSMNFSAVNKNVQLSLEVKEHDCHEQIAYSNDCRIFCDDCLKKLKITQKTEDNLNTVGTKTYVLDSQLDNLVPGETYRYTISRVDGNWPVIVTKQSGEFIAQKNTKLIKTDIGFCYPSGLCAADTRDTMLAYRQNSLYNNSTKKFITLNMAVNQVTCANSITYSDDFTLNCNNCLPTTDYTVVFDNAPESTIVLPISCCSGNKLLSVNVSNAIPGDNHTYQFISASPDVVLSPSSGTVVFQSSGTAKLLTVATINLEQQNQAIVQFKLTNTSSLLEAMGYVAIKCGPDCI